MFEPEDVAKSSGQTEPESRNAVESSPPRTGSEKATLFTASRETTYLKPASGAATIATCAATTPDPSGVLLSEEEGIRLFRIRKDSRLGHMPMFDDHKLLLDIIARFIP